VRHQRKHYENAGIKEEIEFVNASTFSNWSEPTDSSWWEPSSSDSDAANASNEIIEVPRGCEGRLGRNQNSTTADSNSLISTSDWILSLLAVLPTYAKVIIVHQ